MPLMIRFRRGELGIHAAHMFGRKRQECELSRAFDGEREFPLMAGAGADFTAGANLAAVGQIAAQLFGVLVINKLVFVFAVNADPAHGWTKAALLAITTSVTPAAVIAARAPWPARAAALLIFHGLGKLLLKLYSMRG